MNNKPIFVDWAITTKCNLSCMHCRYKGGARSEERGARRKELTTGQVLEIANQINKAKTNWVLIEGGEPFLRKDIFSIIETLKMRGKKQEVRSKKNRSNPSNPWLHERPIYIITSGKGFNEELARKCKDSSVKLMISVDSGNLETYELIRKGASYDEMLKVIGIAQRYRILDSINFTLQQLNSSPREIKAIGQFTYLLNIDKINFLGYKPNICTVSKYSKPKLAQVFSNIVEIQNKYDLRIMVDEPFYRPWLIKSNIKKQKAKITENGPIVVEDKSGCIFGEYLFIEPDGTFKPCSFSPLSLDEIGKETIKKIQDKRNRKGKCGKCEFQLQCGGCRVRTYMMTDDWFESDPYCPL